MNDPSRTFGYHNGVANIYGDPSALRRGLILATGGKLNTLLRDYYSLLSAKRKGLEGDALAAAEATSAAAADFLLPRVREVFGLAPLDPVTGAGVTDDDVDAVLCAFLDYLSNLKKKVVTQPSTQPSSGWDSSQANLLQNCVSASPSTGVSPWAGGPLQ